MDEPATRVGGTLFTGAAADGTLGGRTFGIVFAGGRGYGYNS